MTTDRQERLSDRLARIADGRWSEIIDRSGIDVGSNPSKKTACPLHVEQSGKRKFRFENKSTKNRRLLSIDFESSRLKYYKRI